MFANLSAWYINGSTFSNSSTGRNGTIQRLVIPSTNCYRIDVAGAKGGDNIHRSRLGGNGTTASGTFYLTAGTQISILVGQSGGPAVHYRSGGGGGGGSFVYRTVGGQLLMAAGGGGGASRYDNGRPGQAGVDGGNVVFDPNDNSRGGTNGEPGYNNPLGPTISDNFNHGGCGAGWLGRPVNPRRRAADGDRAGGPAEGWVGGVAGDGNTGDGGFGGGGGGAATPLWDGAGGGGGGFSGGGASVRGMQSGGGGGSFCGGSSCTATSGGNSGIEGSVVLQQIAEKSSTNEYNWNVAADLHACNDM